MEIMHVLNYMLRASNGKMIRTATKVVLENGREIRFMEKMSRDKAISQANDLLTKEAHYHEAIAKAERK